jgi:eukaryotic-like serine/threonine-protein kinase
MSEVWRAHDRTLDRTVALKILSPAADLQRFRREAQALAALTHENVMRVYDYGEDEGVPFMALEWLPGGTLEDRLRQGPLAPDETHRIAQGIAAGLAHIHARGLVHRDLKPANVLFDEEGRPKLGDFGLARHVAGSGTLTGAGTVLGTAAYISPEQAAGRPAGPASDVYSFGVILFRLLTGALPFVADDAVALADMHRHASPPAVETLQPAPPPELAGLAAAALRKDPADRPADGAALLSALGAAPPASGVAETEATRVLPATAEETRLLPGTAAQSEGSRRRRAAIAAGALVLLAAGGGVLAWAVTRSGTHAPAGAVSTGTHKGRHRSTTQAHPGSTQRQQPATSTAPTTTAATTHRTTTTSPATTTQPTTTQGTTTQTTTTQTTTTGSSTTSSTSPGTTPAAGAP